MCDVNCVLWVAKNLTKGEIAGKRVIEVGSYDANGSVRPIIELFEPESYLGVDIVEGPGVDTICRAEQLVERFGKDSFDVVISCTTLEHIKNWREAISNMKNICKSNGLILIIVPSSWPFHAYPYDYWRYAQDDIENIFADCQILMLTEDQKAVSLVYTKIKKPEAFVEKDLSQYPLYSIIMDKKIIDLNDNDYTKFIRKYKMKRIISRVFNKMGSYLGNN